VFGPSGLAVDLDAGQLVTVVVDGSFGAATGNFDLNIGQLGGVCPDGDLGNSVPTVIDDSTAGAQNSTTGSCAGFSSPDDTWTWTAPADGYYTFSTEGSAFDTAVYVREDDCSGPELGCSNDLGGGDTTSRIAAFLTQNDTVAVTVDGNGAEGDYTLTIDQVICPGVDMGSVVPQTQSGSTSGNPDLLYGGCGAQGGSESTFSFTAAVDGAYVFDTNGSGFDTTLYLLDGPTCGDPILACNDDGGIGTQSQLTLPMAAGQDVVVVVDGYGSASGAFELNVDLLDLDCPDADIGNAVPHTQMGSTAGLPNELTPSCGFSNAPEDALTWTAPADGTYTIDTNGSTFDTILHVLDGDDCFGASLGCNDDGGAGTQSLLTVDLVAGQIVTIVVDGYSANSGAYVLNIN
jgi:hypothetical protein